jgi:hypothetical protein
MSSSVRATYDELASRGLTACHVAVGHRIGEPGFAIVLGAVAGDITADFVESGERTMEIVVDRVRYGIDRTGRVICGIPVYRGRPSDLEFRATAARLQRQFGPRLNPDNRPDSVQR